MTALFKSRAASRDVRVKTVEFLYFYLMPEAPPPPALDAAAARRRPVLGEVGVHWSPSKRAGSGNGQEGRTKGTDEKQEMLGKYLGNVDDLVEDLRERMPFGTTF